jgi:hypothetical protein
MKRPGRMKRRALTGPVARGLPLLLAGTAGCRRGDAPDAAGGGGGATPVGAPARDEALRRAVADAATRAGVPAAQVRTVQAADRDWPDGAMGCPEPGRFYTQAIVPGYLIELEAGGRRLTYHTDRQGTIVLCSGGRPSPVP